jgi:hypothetical protein
MKINKEGRKNNEKNKRKDDGCVCGWKGHILS